MRPLIGLSTYREQAQWGVWDTSADVLPASYAQAIERAGGVPVLPPSQAEGAAVIISRLDGLVITGSIPGFTSVARVGDGTLAAMEQPGERFCLAVQWHPEVGTDSGLFDALIQACRESSRRG